MIMFECGKWVEVWGRVAGFGMQKFHFKGCSVVYVGSSFFHVPLSISLVIQLLFYATPLIIYSSRHYHKCNYETDMNMCDEVSAFILKKGSQKKGQNWVKKNARYEF